MKKLVLLLSAFPLYGGELILAERGKPAEYTIVLPAEPSPSQRYAAEELQSFTEQMTGVRLPIAGATQTVSTKTIRLGCTTEPRLGTDGFRLCTDGTNLEVCASSVRGTLYGVYEILETYGGCRWYSSWHSVIPKVDRLTVPDTLDDVQIPAFPHREPFWFDMFNGDFAARNRANGPSMKVTAKHGGPAGRFGGGLGNCHTFQRLLPSSKYGVEHPEYFALRDGVRLVAQPKQSDDFVTQPCLTNPDVLRIVTSNVLAAIRRDPTATYYGVSQNDNGKFCTCPACAAIDAEEESHAGTMVRFVNAVAAAVEKEFPDKIIEFLAYRYTRKPPKFTKLRDNVMPCLCSIECDFSRPLDESKFPANISFVADMKGWAAQAKRLYVWDYVTDFHNYPAPMANVYALQGNAKFMRDHGVQAYFTQGDRQGSHAGFSDLKAWLLAKWMWNPDRPMKPLLDDFFAGCYGPAAPFVRDYFEKVHAYTRAYTAESPDHALFCEPPGLNKGVPEAFWIEAGRLLDPAAAAVAGQDAYAFNVRFVRFGADYMRLETARKTQAPVVDLSGSPRSAETTADLCATAQRALAFFAAHPTIRICSSMPRQANVISAWRQLAARTEPRTDGVLEDAFIGFNSDRRVSRVKDPTAADGSALRFADPIPRWSSMTALSSVAFRPGRLCRLQIRVRVDAPAVQKQKGNALTAGIYDPQAKKHRAEIAVPVARATASYADFTSAPFNPDELSESAYLFIGDGYFKTSGDESPHPVYVDSVKFIPVEK